MLVLSRKVGERVQIGESVTVSVLEISGGRVKLAFDGPLNVPIHREEVYRRIREEEEPREHSLINC